jgi:hypothetical protein
VICGPTGVDEADPFNYNKLAAEQDNFYLRNGDIVLVPEEPTSTLWKTKRAGGMNLDGMLAIWSRRNGWRSCLRRAVDGGDQHHRLRPDIYRSTAEVLVDRQQIPRRS